ncbi:MAG: type II toxin-antitoxin system VapC family toxin [Bauldia sp.]|nr:type II toxin-antitoxin system VapC family toxin [Bauldia sp.]
MSPILLDTCALIWIAEGRLTAAANDALAERFAASVAVYVSPVTAWEVGLLSSLGRLALRMDPVRWFEAALERPGTQVAPLSPTTLVAASFLPGAPPRDPADRILIATARHLACPVMTRDRAILAYAEERHVAAITC